TKRFSREDLLSAFDLLSKAESDIRSASQPRYHLEMALLRWIHLRKLVSIEDLIAGAPTAVRGAALSGPPSAAPTPKSSVASGLSRTEPAAKPAPPPVKSAPPGPPSPNASFKDAFLAEVRKNKA